MRLFKKLLVITVSTVFLFVSFTGCKNKDDKLITINLSEVAHSVFYAPQYVADALGYFNEEGLNINITCGNGADKVMTSVLSGECEIGLAGPEASIYVYLEGRENYSVIFSQLTRRDGAFIVGREKDDSFTLDKMKNSYIIGGRAGGVPLMTLRYVLHTNGIEPDRDITVDSSVQFAMMAGAFTGGTGDYVALFEPTASLVEKEGKGYILGSVGALSGEIPYTAYFCSKSFRDNNEEILEKFTRAITRGQKWVETHSAEEIAEVILPYFPDSDLDILISATDRHKSIGAWNTDSVMTEESFNKLQDVMEYNGVLEKRVLMKDIVDNSFAEKVK